MRIIPVMDLLGGSVVRGIGGRRDEYRPIVSRLCRDALPSTVARSLRDHFGFQIAYIADLDAIGGGEPEWSVYHELLAAGWRLWIDAGIDSTARAEQLAAFTQHDRQLDGVVVGLESLANSDLLVDLLAIVGPERLVFSLDLKLGHPITRIGGWQQRSPLEIARVAIQAGVQRFIVLDLAGVGVSGGITTLELCRDIRQVASSIEIVTGGGVRNIDDIHAADEAGCDGLLVASALHDGRLAVDDVRRFR